MKFSRKIQEMEVSGIRKCFEGAPPGAINLGIGQPDFDTPDHIKQAALEAIEKGMTAYTPNCGFPQLRAAASEKFRKENGLDYSPEEIMVTSGASEALFLAISALVDRGDEVLIGNPSFLSYSSLTQLSGGKAVPVPLNNRLALSPEAVEERITDHTKAVVVNSPSNPTGAVQTADEMEAIAQICDDHDICLISDEVYEHFLYGGEHVSPAKFSDNVITINAVSKTYAMTGWRIGYLGAKGDVVEQLLKAHQYVQACACSVSQAAALAALTGPQDSVFSMRDEFRRRRDVLIEGFREMGVPLIKPEGAFYLFPKVGDGDAVAARLTAAGVITVPGSAFGPGGREHIRLSYASSMESIKEAITRMRGIL